MSDSMGPLDVGKESVMVKPVKRRRYPYRVVVRGRTYHGTATVVACVGGGVWQVRRTLADDGIAEVNVAVWDGVGFDGSESVVSQAQREVRS